jgi:conjugative transfer region protein TrbK
MDMKMLARLGALVFVVVAILATAVEFGRKEVEPSPLPSASSGEPDPLRAELVRCQMLGEAGIRDTACLRAWAENRRRFMASGARPMDRLSETPPSTAAEHPIQKGTQSATATPESE